MSEPSTHPAQLMMADPIVGRETLSRLRNGYTYLVFVLPPLLQSIALLGILVMGQRGKYDPGRDPGALGFQIVFWIQALTVGLVLPAVAAFSFSQERTDGTLPLLAATGLSPARIYRGKFLSLLLYGLTAIGCSLPIWLFLLFELQPAAYWAHVAMLGSFLLLEITLCLFWSALSPEGITAALLSYLSTAWWGLILILLAALWHPGVQLLALLTFGAALLFGLLGYISIKEHGLTD